MITGYFLWFFCPTYLRISCQIATWTLNCSRSLDLCASEKRLYLVNGWVNGFWQSFSTSKTFQKCRRRRLQRRKSPQSSQRRKMRMYLSPAVSFLPQRRKWLFQWLMMLMVLMPKKIMVYIITYHLYFRRMSCFCLFGRMFRVNPPVVPAKLRQRSVAAQGDQRKTHPKRRAAKEVTSFYPRD